MRSNNNSGNTPLVLRVVTLNCWALHQPWPFGSRDRHYRVQKIGEALLEEKYDVAALQEVWSENDFVRLQEMLREEYPFSYYFHSGFTGSGVCIFCRHPIVSTLMHRYSLNGFAHHIHRGDWFGGKVVGLVEIEIGHCRINFYATHLHAEYNRENDLYLPHRLSQAFELAQFVKHTGYSADLIILTGDFNIEPDDLGYHLIVKNANLKDAWIQKPNKCGDCGATCDRPDNCYTPQCVKSEASSGKRLDYIMYKSGRSNVELLRCETRLNRIPGEKAINYSDHIGVYAEFAVSDHNKIIKELSLTPPNLLKEGMKILEDGISRVSCDRRLFLGLSAVFGALIISALFVEQHYPGITYATAIFRFLLTLLIGFCLWHGFIGLTMELKALKASKASMRMLLND